jgi:ABC transport system ATP-binding/permease protein
MPILRLEKVSLSYGLKPLLDEVVLQIRKGERLCLLGRNGEGKSSLLGLVARRTAPDSGEVWVRPGARVASLAQEVAVGSDLTVRELLREVAEGEDWQAELNVDQILARLELDGAAHLQELSGGWRRRVMLGRALVVEPDLLLLDEPTNHLDIEAIAWLEEMMLEFNGALLFVSHDRAFVRRLATRIVELDRGQMRSWPGNYDEYVTQKRAALEVEAKHAALFDKKLAQEEVWIRRGVEARRTRNEGRVRALKQLRIDHRNRRDRQGSVQITVQDANPSGKLVFEAESVGLDFGERCIIRDFSARVMRGDRIGIIGPNGCGKSTLIKLLIGELEPTRGTLKRGTQLMPAYFDQQREQLDESASIMDNVTRGSGDTVIINGEPRHISGYLRDFLFPPERLRAPVSMLSGGERNRLLLARLFARPSNLLVMDEPTNDLDTDTLELLEEMVSEYPGTLLLVSHDRTFLDNVVTSTMVFEGGGRINEYVGGYSDWLKQRREAPGAARPGTSAAPAAAAPVAAAKPRRLSFKEQRELGELPKLIARLEGEQQDLERLVSDPLAFRRDAAQANTALTRLVALGGEIEAAYARWSSLES